MTYLEFQVFVFPWFIITFQWVLVFLTLKWWRKSIDLNRSIIEGWDGSLKLTEKIIDILLKTELENKSLRERLKKYEPEDQTPVQDSSL